MDCRIFAFLMFKPGILKLKKNLKLNLGTKAYQLLREREHKPKFKIYDQKNWGGVTTCILSAPILIVMVQCTYCRPVHVVVHDTLHMYVSMATIHIVILVGM